uniref:Uncharacterized protein n=2 Tax=Dunaliella tertiolecta TaxID=3047 RepID=A0A6S8KGD7_DUNTE
MDIEKREQDLAKLSVLTPGVTSSLQDFCSLALESLKSYKPEIKRLEQKNSNVVEDINEHKAFTRQALDAQDASRSKLEYRTADMEERLNKFEALVSVLPVWKEDLALRIETVAKESKARAEQLAQRQQNIEDQHHQHIQLTRERIDSLSDVMRTLAIARQAHSERMEALERKVQLNEETTNRKLEELEVASKRHDVGILSNARKLTELGVGLSVARVDIESLRDRMTQAEGDIQANRSDFQVMQDRQNLFHKGLMVMERQIKEQEMAVEVQNGRLLKIENDTRVPDLEKVSQDYLNFKSQVGHFISKSDKLFEGLDDRMGKLDHKVEQGPPGLWKLTAQVAAQAEEIAGMQASIKDNSHTASQLEHGITDLRRMMEGAQQALHAANREAQDISSRLAAEVKRMIEYADARVEHLAAKYEVEALRKTVSNVQAELEKAINAMGLRVKFELFHDEMPQVHTIKAYMNQLEFGMARAQERMVCLEEGLHHETTRGAALEAQWKATKATLDALILDGDVDVHAMRQELTRIKKMMGELGKLASKGEILTLQEASSLVDAKLYGPSMDTLLHKKLTANQFFQQQLSHLAPRHELDALKRMVLDAQQELIRLQLQHPSSSPHAIPAVSTATNPSPTFGQSSPRGIPPQLSTLSSISEAQLSADGPKLGEPVGGGEAGALLAVYARMASVEEALAQSGALGSALRERLQANEQQMQAFEVQLSAEMPAVKDQIAAMLELLGRGGGGAGGGAKLPTDACAKHQGPTFSESAVRSVLNKTLLPELVERQAYETRRLVRFVESCLSGMARSHDLESLRHTIEQLRAEAAAGPGAAGSNQHARGKETGKNAASDAAGGKDRAHSRGNGKDAAFGAGGGQECAPASGKRSSSKRVRGNSVGRGEAGNEGPGNAAPAPRAEAEGQQDGEGSQGLSQAGDGVGVAQDVCAHEEKSESAEEQQQSSSGGGECGAARPLDGRTLAAAATAAEELIDPSPSLARHATLLQALDVRLGGLEAEVQRLSHHQQGPHSTQQQQQQQQQQGKQDAQPQGQQQQQQVELQELQLGLEDLRAQLPLLARAYEVEGLQRALTETKDALSARMGGPAANSAAAAAAGPLHLTITLLQQSPPAPQQQQQAGGELVGSEAPEAPGTSTALTQATTAGAEGPQGVTPPPLQTFARVAASHQRAASINPESGPVLPNSQGGQVQEVVSPGAAGAGTIKDAAVADAADSEGATSTGEGHVDDEGNPSNQPPRHAQGEAEGQPGWQQGLQVKEQPQAGSVVSVLSMSGDEVEAVLEALQGIKAAQMAQSAQALSRLSKLEVAVGVGEERARALEEVCAGANKRATAALASLNQALPMLEQQTAEARDVGDRAAAAAASSIASVADAKQTAATALATVQGLERQQAAAAASGGAPQVPQRPQHPYHQFISEKEIEKALKNSTTLVDVVQDIVAGLSYAREESFLADHDFQESSRPSSPLMTRGRHSDTAQILQPSDGSLNGPRASQPFSSQSLRPLHEQGASAGQPGGVNGRHVSSLRPGSAQPQQQQQQLQVQQQPRVWSANQALMSSRTPRMPRAANPSAPRLLVKQTSALRALRRTSSQGWRDGSQGGRDGPAGLPYGFGHQGVPRHLHMAEHADTELTGILHDLMFAQHAELRATGGGPLPGNPQGTLSQVAVREAAAKRLSAQPYECQKHVELLEGAKKELDRLINTAAVSTVDYIALVCLMNDMRVKLVEDMISQHRDQMATAYRNLETVFEYLKHIQVAVNSKASALALTNVDKCLRGVGREMVLMGKPPDVVGGRHEPAGLLHGTALGSPEFWSSFMSGSAPNDITGARFGR